MAPSLLKLAGAAAVGYAANVAAASASEAAAAGLRELFGHLPCEFYSTSIRAAEMVKSQAAPRASNSRANRKSRFAGGTVL